MIKNESIYKRLENLENLITKLLNSRKEFPPLKEILPLKEACLYLGISKSQLYSITSKNLISFFKPGGKLIYFKKADLDAWALSNPISTNTELAMKASQHILKTNPINLN